jgi:hypothetical protein
MGLCQHQPPRSPRDLGQTCYPNNPRYGLICVWRWLAPQLIRLEPRRHGHRGRRFLYLTVFFEDPPTSHKLREWFLLVKPHETTIFFPGTVPVTILFTVLLLIDCFNHVQGFPGAMTHRLRPCTPRSCTPRSPQAKPPGTTRDFWTSSTGQYALNHFISFSTYANL